LAELTRAHVTVSLSADGGDELFAGYNTYIWAPRLWEKISLLGPARRPLARSRAIRTLIAAGARLAGNPQLGHRALRSMELLGASDPIGVFRSLTTHWPLGASPVLGAALPVDVRPEPPAALSELAAMRYLDASSYLPEDVLVKVDRATMAF